ncbi:di-heme oxidoredictase family protein [Oceaniradius stylonematis]|uniref:di-heme oxidoredictase family protein n=1 Tax=Oceaniradius stylonematis TaxID=2184161 RepID=UPI00273F4129|nr:di-heme oxidoredictase family protein [Oceaniradius stylonematis]
MAPAFHAVADWDPPAVKDFPNHAEFAGEGSDAQALTEIGRRLFTTKFNVHDGAGRPAATGDSKPTIRFPEHNISFARIAGPDAMACSSCHNDPNVGGSGDFVTNVFVGAHLTDPPTQSTDPIITAERNTIGINGAGLIELLSREITIDLQDQREKAKLEAYISGESVDVSLTSKGIDFGTITVLPNGSTVVKDTLPIDYDLIIRPFGVKGVASSLREFTLFALNQHHGIQAIERFGWERTGLNDFDLDGVENEFSIGQVSALVAFQANLPPPQPKLSESASLREAEMTGERIFNTIGCNQCHIPELDLESAIFTEPSPFNRPGAVTPSDVSDVIYLNVIPSVQGGAVVSAYTDFRRHNLCDSEVKHFCNERIRQDNIDSELFLTSKLWDLATSAPYGHRGDLGTISEAILAHGGDARTQRDKFVSLPDRMKKALISFLLTLGRQ